MEQRVENIVGEKAYELRVSGLPWKDIAKKMMFQGKNQVAYLNAAAKMYAIYSGKEWPVKIKKKHPWVVVTPNMKFPPVSVDTEIEILDMSGCGGYIVGREAEFGRVLRRKAGDCIWHRTSVHAYKLL